MEMEGGSKRKKRQKEAAAASGPPPTTHPPTRTHSLRYTLGPRSSVLDCKLGTLNSDSKTLNSKLPIPQLVEYYQSCVDRFSVIHSYMHNCPSMKPAGCLVGWAGTRWCG